MKWELAFSVLCDKNVQSNIKNCGPVKKSHIQEMKIVKIKMLKWMRGHIRKNKIRNEATRDKMRATFVVDKMRETSLRWSGEEKMHTLLSEKE
ncbi:hypothetical protein H5410_025765 [Solanum commersonii]|uniref:Uncharacterized protein n=1 Tax=Solanum commersonii TaxID=4109 RepID=A0A9J5YUN9_SOLCO|nr:hypothetical protein H5410_025765 [Solanum commersonii]